MKKIKLIRNPYLLFSPFLLFYIILLIIFSVNYLQGDEFRYIYFTKNLLNGFYSPAAPYIDLNGPGYPIILIPFVALKVPLLVIRLSNVLFYYLSIIFLFKATREVASFNKAFLISLFWGFNYVAFGFMYLILTEIFTVFLISIMTFTFIKAFNSEDSKIQKRFTWLSGFVVGYIALTKIIFGYVILCLLVGVGLLWLMKRNVNYRKGLVILLIALGTTTPYLIYTYYLTGRICYWGTAGGANLYWMSSPSQNEYGTWFPDIHGIQQKNTLIRIPRIFVPGAEDSLRLYHQKDYNEFNKHYGVELDDAFKEIAYRNIRSHPVKYLQNCVTNIGRMLFDYPNSYMIQKPGDLLRLPLNGIITVVSLLCLFPTLKNWRKIDYSVRFLLFFAIVYLGGSIPGSAEIRMFIVIAPVILVWIAFIIQKSVRININFYKNNDRNINSA